MAKTFKDIQDRMNQYENFLTSLVCKVSQSHRIRLQAHLDKMGITFPEFNIVGTLLKHPEGLSQKHLADELELTGATMSVALGNLEKKGVIFRDSDENDSRVKKVKVNLDAMTKAEEIHDMLQQMEERALEGLAEKDRQTVSEALEMMANNLKKGLGLVLLALGLTSSLSAESLDLQQALRSAIENSPMLKASQQKEDIARGEAYQALTPYDPRLVASASKYERDEPQSFGFPGESEGHDLSVGLKSAIPLGGDLFVGLSGSKKNTLLTPGGFFAPMSNPEYRSGLNVNYRQSLLKDFIFLPGFAVIKAGFARIDAATYRAKREKAELLANVTRAYAAWLAAAENADISRSSWDEAREFYNKTQRKHKQGLEELAELLQAESTLHARHADYLAARDRELDAKESLWVSMGRQPGDAAEDNSSAVSIEHGHWKLARDLESLEREAREKRQDLKATVKDVEQMAAFYQRAKSLALPDLAFTYDYKQAGLDATMSDSVASRGNHPSHTMTLSLNLPLWPYLGGRGEILQARGRARQASLMLKVAELELKRQARSAYRGWRTAEEAMDLADKRVRLEKRKLVQIKRRYRDGQISGRELLLNENDLLMARMAQSAARQALVHAKVQMLLTQGSFIDNALAMDQR